MTAHEYTSPQIDVITGRATKFLSAVSQLPAIRAALHQGGYSEGDHGRGWALLLAVLGYQLPPHSAPSQAEQVRQREAASQLDQWDGPAFDRARAALEHRFPEQASYVFANLSAKSGPDSIGAVRTFLDRVGALRAGSDPARSATRTEDAAAAELLAQRRIVDVHEEQRLRALIDDAIRIAELPLAAEPDPSQRQQTLRELDAWLRDWRETARTLVTRRDYQIRLGLAERRSPQPKPAA
jgi:hypothetical protein